MSTKPDIYQALESLNFALFHHAPDEPFNIEMVDSFLIAVSETDVDELQSIGEFSAVSATEMVVALWYALADCHSGQWSPEYSAFCRVSKLYTPGPCSSVESEGSGVSMAYESLCYELVGCPYEKVCE